MAVDIRQRANGREILLVTHKGNWGDALIINGARNFLRWHGFRFREVYGARGIGRQLDMTLSAQPPRDFFPVFTAGGSISRLYGHVEKLRKATHAYRGGVILSATCGLPYDSIDLHPETSLWLRDRGESAKNHPMGNFCHDMAFFTSARRFPKLRNLGIFMRNDLERPDAASREGLDLSALGNDRTPVWPFFAIVGSHREIKTNRLHIAVASAICGVPCSLLPGATNKISDVYKASLSSYSSKVALSNY
ncbi:hypothetical protein [Alloyangia pacifica]|uniref:hypothetical protein n=1 Tax=Alloyangia pacifica TaxID=311180 RepID=UPI001CD568F1|nr:hypothetical protein [Alloyangia pacifica]MCA0998770.1 hypothetical protein [Alloyangia pacifica]